MSAKPPAVDRWASTGVRTAPSSGRQDTGYLDNDVVGEGEINWLLGTGGDWDQYLSDQEFEGDLDVDGQYYYETSLPIVIPGADAVDLSSSHSVQAVAHGNVGYLLGASTNKIMYKIPGLRVGDHITGWTITVDKETAALQTILARMYSFAPAALAAGTETGLGSGGSNNTAAPGIISLTEIGAMDVAVAAGVQYYLTLTPSGSVTPNADRCYEATVKVKRPKP